MAEREENAIKQTLISYDKLHAGIVLSKETQIP
jgi:hypothetical protein